MRWGLISTFLLANCAANPPLAETTSPQLKIDAHRHAFAQGVPGDTAEQAMAKMDANGIGLSAIHFATRDTYVNWGAGHEARFLKGVSFPCWRDARREWFACQWDGKAYPDLAWLRAEAKAGRLTHLGELGFVYAGVSPTDPAVMPYWDFAAEHDLPVLVHTNRGPPADGGMRARGCCPNFDPDMGNPALMRPILEKHPKLRLVLQHFGFPPLPVFDDIGYIEESLALMRDYPNVMVDMSTFHSVPFLKPEAHARMVKRLKDEGLLDRLLFATDGWPEAPIIARYEAMEFLTNVERQAIYHSNAERLFKLKR